MNFQREPHKQGGHAQHNRRAALLCTAIANAFPFLGQLRTVIPQVSFAIFADAIYCSRGFVSPSATP
jgi:hypothetical protein